MSALVMTAACQAQPHVEVRSRFPGPDVPTDHREHWRREPGVASPRPLLGTVLAARRSIASLHEKQPSGCVVFRCGSVRNALGGARFAGRCLASLDSSPASSRRLVGEAGEVRLTRDAPLGARVPPRTAHRPGQPAGRSGREMPAEPRRSAPLGQRCATTRRVQLCGPAETAPPGTATWLLHPVRDRIGEGAFRVPAYATWRRTPKSSPQLVKHNATVMTWLADGFQPSEIVSPGFRFGSAVNTAAKRVCG